MLERAAAVGDETGAAILDAGRGIGEVAPAALAQRVERAVAEEAVEILRVLRGVAGKVAAAEVLEKESVFVGPVIRQ